ncbi:MAG: hypothetical protein JWO38_311 [Gemmataceae bacterium]|nr:hypothetical protein [Gemmataceae bacterium]
MTPNLPNGEAPKGQHAAPRSAPADPAGLTDSLRRFRGQTPQESLGLASGNSLLWPFVQASVVTAILFAALTAGPYLWEKQPAAAADSGQPAKTENPAATPPPASPAPPPTTPAPDTTAKKPADVTRPPTGGKKDITDVLGESGTKPASPKVNPLDKKEDDLLKDIK